jgi:protein-L-isoaspartate(D-aspartate) O-methyltransferase
MNANGMGTATATIQFDSARKEMVARQIRDRGIHSQSVLDAMLAVPRHEFVPASCLAEAYDDKPLQIGEAQTISQPYMVAAAAEALAIEPADRVLEIGCGSGYQAAVLSHLAREVFAIEFRTHLAASARERLSRLGYKNVSVVSGDGSLGWPLASPYQAILVSAAAPAVPSALVDQLAEGGRLVIPVGHADQQDLMLLVKKENRVTQQTLFPCRFVPLLGLHGWRVRPDGALEK